MECDLINGPTAAIAAKAQLFASQSQNRACDSDFQATRRFRLALPQPIKPGRTSI
jgi:hypothetical protein